MNDAMTAPITPSLTEAELERIVDHFGGDMKAMARELLAYRRAGVAVKPLEWNAEDFAQDGWGGYWITQNIRDQYGWAHSSRGDWDDSQPDVWETADEAKAGAQADYASRILGALVTPPPASRADAALRAARPVGWFGFCQSTGEYTAEWCSVEPAEPYGFHPLYAAPQPDIPFEYTDAMGVAGDAYIASVAFKGQHDLPAQFRWRDLWASMRRAALSTPAPSRPDEGPS